MSALFRTQLVLMLFEQDIDGDSVPLFGYGQHVSDDRAFAVRLSNTRWTVRR